MMREVKGFPEKVNVAEVLDLYFQIRAIELNCEQLSVLAGTLASGGICPTSGEKVFELDHTRDCGLYDYSGEWAFKIGLPAKSAISGAIFVVIPNRMGIAIYSPKLDNNGNSKRAILFAEKLVERFSFHHLDSIINFGGIEKTPQSAEDMNSHRFRHSKSSANLSLMMKAAVTGDVKGMEDIVLAMGDVLHRNYDGRTALHLAAAGGHYELIKFLAYNMEGDLRPAAELNSVDRWGRTALDEAEFKGFEDCAEVLEGFGCVRMIKEKKKSK